jgi:hypothetical protein
MPNYEIRELQKQLKVYADGQYVAAVQEGKFRPYVYPFFTPAGHNVLQIAPADHLHHLGICLGHEFVSRLVDSPEPETSDRDGWGEYQPYAGGRTASGSEAVDFWGTESFLLGPLPRILVRSTNTDVGEHGVSFDQEIEWRDAEDYLLLCERRRTTVTAGSDANIIDLVTNLEAPGYPVELRKAKDAGLLVRVADQIDVLDGGRIVNAEGRENEEETFGRVSAWVDCSGHVTRDAVAGISVFPIPESDEHPWHTRDYGPMWINPWQHEPMTLQTGQTYTIGARFVAHDGSCEDADVAGLFRGFREGR